MKDRLKKAGEIERREASTSPQSTCSDLDQHQLSPDSRDRGRSNGAMFHDDLASRPQVALFPESFSEQYASVQATPFQQYDAGYSQQMDTSTIPYSYSAHGDALETSYAPYLQNGSLANQSSLNGAFSGSTNQRQYHVQNVSMPSTRGLALSSTSPTSHGNFYNAPRGSAYSTQMAQQNYGNVQVPYNNGYTESDTSVMLSDFLCSSYRS